MKTLLDALLAVTIAEAIFGAMFLCGAAVMVLLLRAPQRDDLPPDGGN
jgi:hypothetical protein